MTNRINYICFADDDADDHFIFSTALKEVFPSIILTAFLHCDDLLDYLNDDSKLLPDIIFLDYNMPGNDGNKCLRMIKKTARILNVPVIIYSTSDYQKIIDESYKLGAIKYIVKPSSFAEVRDTLKEVIAGFETANSNH